MYFKIENNSVDRTIFDAYVNFIFSSHEQKKINQNTCTHRHRMFHSCVPERYSRDCRSHYNRRLFSGDEVPRFGRFQALLHLFEVKIVKDFFNLCFVKKKLTKLLHKLILFFTHVTFIVSWKRICVKIGSYVAN